MFKLINFFEVPHFNQLRFEMQAPEAKRYKACNETKLLDEESIRRLGQEGIDVDLKDVVTLKDNTLSYKGQRVLVYIRDVMHYRKENNLPRYHIAYCKKLEEMRSNGRWARYVVANREDGYFQVSINNTLHKSERLDVCQYCLEALRWNNFTAYRYNKSERRNIVSNFSIVDFFIKYPKSLFSITPIYTSDTAPSNTYSSNWPLLSENLKQERGYRCGTSNCNITLDGKDRRFLHVHHINGIRNDNSKNNLEVLCYRCHANEPLHSHMKSTKDYEEFTSKYPYSDR
jgi:hypothetical protein